MDRNKISTTTRMKVMAEAVTCYADTYRQTCENMKTAKFRRLGGGHYGSAWTRDDIEGWAIKISGADDGDSFPAYVYWCIANPMPHIPEYQHPVFNEDREQFMVMMPQYRPCFDEIQNGVGTLRTTFKRMSDALAGWASPEPGPDYEIQQAAWHVRNFFSGKVSFDMHDENVMIDPLTNRLIITDPIHQGDTDSMISQITGKPVPKYQEQHQLALDLVAASPIASAPRLSSRDSLKGLHELLNGGGCGVGCDRFDMQVGRPVRQMRHVSHPQLQNLPGAHMTGKFWDVLNMQWKTGPGAPMFLKARRPLGLEPIRIDGELPDGIDIQEIGRVLQGVDLVARMRAGDRDIVIRLPPKLRSPEFLAHHMPIPDRAVNIRTVKMSLAQAEFLQRQWRVSHEEEHPFHPFPNFKLPKLGGLNVRDDV